MIFHHFFFFFFINELSDRIREFLPFLRRLLRVDYLFLNSTVYILDCIFLLEQTIFRHFFL